jgi:anoctamin-10
VSLPLSKDIGEGHTEIQQEYLPTILLAISLPFINSKFESAATSLTEYENHRTEDRHETAVTQKIFVLSSITKYLPILLTAFVYVPCGDIVVEYVESILGLAITSIRGFASTAHFSVDSSRLRNEVAALVVTEQLLGFGEELILPMFKRKATRWYGEVQARRTGAFNTDPANPTTTPLLDSPSRGAAETRLPVQARNEAESEKYNVQDDIQEMVIQFGYLALFSPVWPLIPVGFLINNWIELRSDFLKICIEHQRPAPIRADSIGPWLDSLSFLNWLGSISTAAIVYLFRNGSSGSSYSGSNLYALAATIFVSEHIYLAIRYVVRMALQRIRSDTAKKTAKELYAFRKGLMDELDMDCEAAKEKGDESEQSDGDDGLWFNDSASSVEIGLRLIKSMGNGREVKKEA